MVPSTDLKDVCWLVMVLRKDVHPDPGFPRTTIGTGHLSASDIHTKQGKQRALLTEHLARTNNTFESA